MANLHIDLVKVAVVMCLLCSYNAAASRGHRSIIRSVAAPGSSGQTSSTVNPKSVVANGGVNKMRPPEWIANDTQRDMCEVGYPHQHCGICPADDTSCPSNPCQNNGLHRFWRFGNSHKRQHWCDCSGTNWTGVNCTEPTTSPNCNLAGGPMACNMMTSTTSTTKLITESPSTKPPTTQSTSTTKPTTQPPATTKPTTQHPATTKLTTQPPETTKPTTQPPETTKRTTQHPETTKPTTQPPETTKPTTQPPETTKPTTQPPETTKPTTQHPATTTPTTHPPATIKHTTQPPETTKPTTHPPATIKHTTQPPATTKHTTQPPATTKPPTTQLSIVRSARYCPKQVRRNINWPQTDNGLVSEELCPNGAIGTARWRCSEMGTWMGTPDLSNCVSSWLRNVTEAGGPAEDIISSLADHLERQDNIYGGDVSETITLLGSNVEKLEQQHISLPLEVQNAVVTKFTTTMIRVVNALLRRRKVIGAAWSDIPRERRSDVASGIMNSTEKTGILFARKPGKKTFSIVMDNVAMDIGTASGGGSTFPNLTNISDWANVKDGIILPESQEPVVAVLYKTLGQYLQPDPKMRTVNSRVISATLVNRNSSNDVKVAGNVTIYLEHTNKTSNKSSCVFWNISLGDWSDTGCTANITDMNHTVCVCNHLTSFAILVDVTGQQHSFALSVITYIGCAISIACLFFCICTFLGFRRVRCTRTIIHANLCICLLVAEVVFLTAVDKTENKIVCDVIAIILHYLFLAVFTWMCVEGVELYVLLVKVFNLKMNRLLYYHLVGYGAPAVVVGISVVIDYFVEFKDIDEVNDTEEEGFFDGYGTDTYCWLSVDNYFIWSFVGPMLLVVLVNIGFLAMTMRVIFTQKAHDTSNQSEQGNNFRFWIRVSMALVCILGITWVFGVLYVSRETVVFAYVFTISNSFQGLFIFIFHCLLNETVQDEIERRFGARFSCCSKKKRQKTVRRQTRRTARSPQQQEIWLDDFTDTKDSHSSATNTKDTLDDEGFVENTIYEGGAGAEGSVDNVIYEGRPD